MSDQLIVTIDGPVASGKSSVSRQIAKEFGWSWVSTGAFYRGLAYVAIRENVLPDDETKLASLTQSNIWSVKLDDDDTRVIYHDQDVTDQIRTEKVGAVASQISRFPKVRQGLLEPQRKCARAGHGLVAEGRDCGTVVFPQAQLKIYLTASSSERAARRATEQGLSLQEAAQAQQQRDNRDRTREAAPMQIPANAHVIDTSSMGLDEVIAMITGLVRTTLHIS